MTDAPAPDDRAEQQPAPGASARERAERRRRLAEIFGEVIPEQTADDRAGSGDGLDRRAEEKAQEAWLESQVPPHHG